MQDREATGARCDVHCADRRYRHAEFLAPPNQKLQATCFAQILNAPEREQDEVDHRLPGAQITKLLMIDQRKQLHPIDQDPEATGKGEAQPDKASEEPVLRIVNCGERFVKVHCVGCKKNGRGDRLTITAPKGFIQICGALLG